MKCPCDTCADEARGEGPCPFCAKYCMPAYSMGLTTPFLTRDARLVIHAMRGRTTPEIKKQALQSVVSAGMSYLRSKLPQP